MPTPNFDGIKRSFRPKIKPHYVKAAANIRTRQPIMDIRRMPRVSAGVKISVTTAAITVRSSSRRPGPQFFAPSGPEKFFRHFSGPLYRQALNISLTALTLLIAFGFGVWYAASTPKSEAQDPAAPSAFSPSSAPIPMGSVAIASSSLNTITNDMLFNTPIELLQQYLADAAGPSQLDQRAARLKEFLQQWDSPLAGRADLIARQPHWKLILAISFAESTMGKHCQDNNCSGIGGSNLKAYKSLDNWILDFNRLLENRYKNQTLEQMCGVYVQPCNPNWLLATRQILSALEEQKIN